ncbi:hypothetical protein KP509_27G036800 [Ceratopteris richardii]|nr:hypothetical protein KP509_27G036800 [Ceratopteris richardii]
MYAKCGAVERAQDAFDKLGAPNLVTWNALITAYVQNGHYQKAIGRFDQMQSEGLRPDAVSFTCALKACGSVGALGKGRDIHFQVLKEHLLEKDVILAGALVDMYAKCGAIGEAQRVLEYTPLRNKVMWNSLITGYCHHGFGRDAIRCYEQMQLEGFVPDAVTYSSILRACGSIGELDMGIEIHAQMIKSSFLEDDIIVGNALVDMYAKCGALRKATEVFCELPVRDVIAWTALITGYGMHGKGEGALKLFEQMQQEGLSPNSVTYASILKACGNIGALKTCQEIHAQIVKECIYEGHIQVCTALLDVYVKCGMPEEAHSVFEKLPVHDIVSWAALMAGYAQTGEIEIVFHLFDTMLGEGINPNISIFTILLNICNHRGLLEKGQMYFQMMTEGYSMIPTLDHYTCMVNLYGRSGHLDKAARLIQKMQQRPDLQLWLTFLHACQKWQSVQFGTWAFDHAVQVGVANSAVYACMGNIYADAGRHDDAHRILSRSWHKQAS